MKRQEAAASVRSTIIAIILLSSVVLSLLVYFVANAILLDSYLAIEREATEGSVGRVHDIVQSRLTRLETMVYDWSAWDDTYAFIQDRNEAYIASNLVDKTLENFGLDAIIFVDAQGNIVYLKTLGTGSKAQSAAQNLATHIETHPTLTAHTNTDDVVSGVIDLPEGPMLLASRPIITSGEQGPVRGSLIFAYYLTEARVAEIGELAHLAVDIYPYHLDPLPDDVDLAKKHLDITGDIYVRPLSEEKVAGYGMIRDVYGQSLLVSRVTTDRPIYAQGQYIFRVFTLALGLSTVFFGLMIIFMLERFIIKRLAILDQQVAEITETKNLSLRVDNGRGDEIGKLANSINVMVGELQKTQEQERLAKEEAASANAKLSASLDEMQKVNRLMVGRELKMIEMKKEMAKAQRRSGSV